MPYVTLTLQLPIIHLVNIVLKEWNWYHGYTRTPPPIFSDQNLPTYLDTGMYIVYQQHVPTYCICSLFQKYVCRLIAWRSLIIAVAMLFLIGILSFYQWNYALAVNYVEFVDAFWGRIMCKWLYSIGILKLFWHLRKNWKWIETFTFLFSANTLSVWKLIAHDPALKSIPMYF